MYARRIQLTNYGPIDALDITFPFSGDDMPKPVVLVGENGSGKSILLSHIVNSLVMAKGITYPQSLEVETGLVYKNRSNHYIKTGREYYFARVEFADGLFTTELRARQTKESYTMTPKGIEGTDAKQSWDGMEADAYEFFDSSFASGLLGSQPADKQQIDANIAKRCVLYFPANRFEEPAWLNAANLTASAQHERNPSLVVGETHRRIIVDSALRENQNWFFGLVYDMATTEMMVTRPDAAEDQQGHGQPARPGNPLIQFSGQASRIHACATELLEHITRRPEARFAIGNRKVRLVRVFDGDEVIAPNVFLLSSGETSLLNLGLSILRDYDACDEPFDNPRNIRGIVVIDEIDLHLHVHHQSDVLPRFIEMFPGVQFIVTSHSPLFVLGMRNMFGDDGFYIYRLPDGQKISAEEFSEFGDAYRAFTDTRKHADELRKAIEEANGPVVCFEGPTDVRYVKRAAELLSRTASLGDVDFLNIGGEGNLRNAWKGIVSSLAGHLGGKIVLVADCDSTQTDADRGPLAWRRIPRVLDNPVRDGIENLFTKEALEEAYAYDRQLFDTTAQVKKEKPDRTESFEQWVIRKERKADLCDWLCANGTAEHFRHFSTVLDLIEAALSDTGKVG